MARPKPGQAQFRNQYDEDCPYYCCKVEDRYKLTNNIFFWLQAFLNHATSSRFKAPQRAVILAVYSFWSPKRPVCTASQHTIARRAGCQRSTVQKTLALAVQEGWLAETKHTGRRANEYTPVVPSTFHRAHSTPIGNVSDAEELTREEMSKGLSMMRERLQWARESHLTGDRVRPLPAGKHLSDLGIGEVFNVGGKGLTSDEIAHHALKDPELSALIASKCPEDPSTQEIVSLVHDVFNSGHESLMEAEGGGEDEFEVEVSSSRRRVVIRH